MSHRRLWVSASIIAFIIIGGFVFSVPHTRDVALPTPPYTATTSVPAVTLHDVYKKGTHTITGSLLMPNACGVVSANVTSPDGQAILVAISLETSQDICLQVPTRANFSVTVAAPQGVPISATINGSAATTTEP